jgi:hypothetical protein
MNPKFIQEIYHELKEEIVVFDREYRCLNVQFNGSVEHPLIVYGWSTMRDYYRIDGNIMLLMTYVGDNHFLLDFLPQEFDPNKLPSYRSYKHFAADPMSFNVTLTPYLAYASQLVSTTTLYYVLLFYFSHTLHLLVTFGIFTLITAEFEQRLWNLHKEFWIRKCDSLWSTR